MQKSSKFLIGVSVLVLAGSVVAAGAYISRRDTSNPAESSNVTMQQDTSEQLPYTQLEGRYLFSGTIVLARAVERYAVTNGQRDYAQPFSQMDTFSPESYDAWATDFECPITDNVVPYEDQINFLVFNCPPQFLPAMSEYFSLYNLANNHTGDQGGEVGLESTRRYIEQYSGQHYGHYDPTVTEDICEVIGLPVRLKTSGGEEKPAQLPVAFCSWHYFNYNRGPTEEELEPARRYAELMPVFGFVEMGAEYLASATDDQRTIAKQIIDSGADFVFANNPHWVQDSEVYKGKLIVYSLGNFIFDQLDEETNRGVSIDTTINTTYDETVDAWIKLAAECQPETHKDTCLDQAKTKELEKIDLSYSYAPVANLNGVRVVTRRADPATQAAVEERLNWQQTLWLLAEAAN